jgi:hypothetical protein
VEEMMMIMIYFAFKCMMTGSFATLKEEKKELSSFGQICYRFLLKSGTDTKAKTVIRKFLKFEGEK